MLYSRRDDPLRPDGHPEFLRNGTRWGREPITRGRKEVGGGEGFYGAKRLSFIERTALIGSNAVTSAHANAFTLKIWYMNRFMSMPGLAIL
jgi:hypothetical protein